MPDHEGNVISPDLSGATPDDGGDGSPEGWGARLFAKLDLSLGKLSAAGEATNRELAKLRREARTMPAIVPQPFSFTYNNANSTVVPAQQGGSGVGCLIGGPDVGRQWHVRSIMVGGTTLAATPTGVAWFLISPGVILDQSITSVADFTKTALPVNAFYGVGQFYVPPNSNVWCLITGGTNASVYTGSITVQDSAFVPSGIEINN